MASFDLEDLRRRMDGALEDLHKEFTGLRTGRAAISLLEPIIVEAYGAEMPMPQVGTVSAPETVLASTAIGAMANPYTNTLGSECVFGSE